jgi:manganese/zinc/iron transport system substrate-binding protein
MHWNKNYLVTALFLIVACSKPADDPRPTVLVTNNILADAVRQVAGPDLRVEALMGAGTDPHIYKARFSDIRRIEEADIIFYNGLHLEGKLAEILDQMPDRAIAVADVLSENELMASGDEESAIDPHIWFDASLWAKVVRGIGDQLSLFDPENASAYQQRASNYATQLDELHLEVDSLMASIPDEHRILITAHDAFGYFGRAYRVEVRGLQGISTVSEYGIRDVSSLVEFVTERRIPAIFIESGIPPRSIESVIAGARQRRHRVIEGGMLYGDSLGGADEPGSTYIGMMRHNVQTIVKALGQTPSL